MDSNHTAPAIVIAAIDGCDGLWREVLLGIEEEGIPVLLQHRPAGEVVDSAWQAARSSPLLVGIGVGATFDKVGGLAKKALLRPVGERSADERVARIEERLLAVVNATGVGPAGLGGDTTALDVHVNTAPCHIAALPLAINMGCCAMRSISLDLEEA